MNRRSDADPHGDIGVETGGAPLAEADGVVIALHGRGARAAGMLQLLREADPTDDRLAHLAPQAAGRTWYPVPFLEPVARNEPHLTSALSAVDRLADRAAGAVGRSRVVLVGFSQGACLASEYAARHPRRYGGVTAFSGGLIGETVEPDRYEGSVEGTPVYLGCSDVDPHIPVERVHETASIFEALEADVTTEIFPGMGHTVNETELATLRSMLGSVGPDG